ARAAPGRRVRRPAAERRALPARRAPAGSPPAPRSRPRAASVPWLDACLAPRASASAPDRDAPRVRTSSVYRSTLGVERRLAERFGQRRMGMDRPDQLGRRRLEAPREASLGDELRDPGADHVHPEHRAIPPLADDPDEPLRLPGPHRLP